jgi:hypothetical protein
MSAYGQVGFRRNLFLNAFERHIRDITIVKFRKSIKFDYDKYTKVPIPLSLQSHIKINQLRSNQIVMSSQNLINLYNKLL